MNDALISWRACWLRKSNAPKGYLGNEGIR